MTPLFQTIQDMIDRLSDEVWISVRLTNTLYECYHGHYPIDSTLPTDNATIFPEAQSAISVTMVRNYYWYVDHQEENGSVVISKGSHRRREPPGCHSLIGQQDKKDVAIWTFPKRFVSSQKAHPTDSSTWYWVYGNQRIHDDSPAIIRFYFHLKPEPEPIRAFIRLLEQRLDEHRIPFEFKCINNLTAFTRADTAILYLERSHFFYVIPILTELYAFIEPYLRPEVPAFTRRVRPGLGFGENPFSLKESFGSFRCRLLAEAIIKAQGDGRPKETWADLAYQYFIHKRFDPQQPYLNPGSLFQYDFSAFDEAKPPSFASTVAEQHALNPATDLRTACLHYARQIGYTLCREAFWDEKRNHCNWLSIHEKGDAAVYRPLQHIADLTGIWLFLSTLRRSLLTDEPILDQTIAGVNRLCAKKRENKLWTKETRSPIPVNWKQNRFFNSIQEYVSPDPAPLPDFGGDKQDEELVAMYKSLAERPIDEEARLLARRIIDNVLAPGIVLGNGYGYNDYFCPTLSHGLASIGFFLLRVYNPGGIPQSAASAAPAA